MPPFLLVPFFLFCLFADSPDFWPSPRKANGGVGSNTTLHCQTKNLNRCSPTRIPVQTEIDIAEWEE